MEPIFICFRDVKLYNNNKFALEFPRTDQIYTIHFSPKKDYYIASMNCDLNLEQDFKNDGILNEIRELSEKRRQLLAKGPAYQNDIKDVYLYAGVAGTTQQQITLIFLNATANINRFSWHYKFYDVEEKKIRDCKIWSPYD